MARLPPQTSVLLLFLAIAALVPVQSRSNFAEDVGNPLRKLLQGASRAGLQAGKVQLQVPAGQVPWHALATTVRQQDPSILPRRWLAARSNDTGGSVGGTWRRRQRHAACRRPRRRRRLSAAAGVAPPRPAARHPPLRAENSDNHVFERERSSAFACRCATHSLRAPGDPGCQAPLTTSGAARLEGQPCLA